MATVYSLFVSSLDNRCPALNNKMYDTLHGLYITTLTRNEMHVSVFTYIKQIKILDKE